MHRKLNLNIKILFIGLVICLISCKENVSTHGRLKYVGAFPFRELILESDSLKFYIKSFDKDSINKYLNHDVQVDGDIVKENIKSADKKSTLSRQYLKIKHIKIID